MSAPFDLTMLLLYYPRNDPPARTKGADTFSARTKGADTFSARGEFGISGSFFEAHPVASAAASGVAIASTGEVSL